MTYALLALGAVLLIGTAGAVWLPAAGFVTAALCLALGYGLWRSDQTQDAPTGDSG